MSRVGCAVRDMMAWMECVAPLALSQSWDNTGLLLGDPEAPVAKVQTCLTLTLASMQEAVSRAANMVIVHHPLPFKPVAKITTETTAGRILWELANNGIAVYSPHTAWDSAPLGINALLANKLGLTDCQPIIPSDNPALQTQEGGLMGDGTIGALPDALSLASFAEQVTGAVPNCRPRGVDSGRLIRRVAIACGSGGSLLAAALEQGCDVFLTGEATFHTCLEAEAANCCLLMVGHFASERFAMDYLAKRLSDEFPSVDVWASEREEDPIRNLSQLPRN